MKINLLLFVALMFFSTIFYAQNISKVEALTSTKNWQEAYQELKTQEAKDKKNKLARKPEYFYLKGLIFSQLALAKQQIDGISNEELINQGFDNLKKAYEMNKSLPSFIIGQSTPYAQFWDLYGYHYQAGIDAFNSKSFDEASKHYTQTALVGDFLSSNDLGLPALDTNLVYLRAINALNAEDLESVIPFAKQLATVNYKPQENLEIIKWVLLKAMKKNDKALFNEFKALGLKTHPEKKNDLWDIIEDEYKLASAGEDIQKKMNIYEDLIFTQKTASPQIKYNYVVEAYQYILDKKGDIDREEFKSLLTNMKQLSGELFARDTKNYILIYLYEGSFSTYIEKFNKRIGLLKKELRAKAAPVSGNPPKGSKLEKELNGLKAKIKKKKSQLAKLAPEPLPLIDKLIAFLEVEAAKSDADKNLKNQLINSLDIAAGLSDYAKNFDKVDMYDAKRKKWESNR